MGASTRTDDEFSGMTHRRFPARNRCFGLASSSVTINIEPSEYISRSRFRRTLSC